VELVCFIKNRNAPQGGVSVLLTETTVGESFWFFRDDSLGKAVDQDEKDPVEMATL